MPRNVLITGSVVPLGSHLAALCLTSSDAAVFYLARTDEALSPEDLARLVRQAMRRIAPETDADDAEKLTSSRLRWLYSDPAHEGSGQPVTLPHDAQADEVWYLSAGSCRARCRGASANAVRALLSALPQFRAAEFNYVSPVHADSRASDKEGRNSEYAAGDERGATRCAAERDVREQCDALGIRYRIFRTSLLVGEDLPPPGACGEGLLQFLSALHGIKSEIEERLPEYFEYQALRCLAPDGADVNLIRVEEAAEWMLHIAQREDTLGRCHDIVGLENVSFTDLCERVGAAYDLSLLAVAQRQELNAVDQLFQERLYGFQPFLSSPVESVGAGARLAAEFAPPSASLDADAQIALFRAVRRSQDAARAGRAARVAALSTALERKTIDRGGSGLTYYAGGSGSPPIVLINALGQGLHYWYRLMDELMRRRRVIIWEPRGLESTTRSFRLDDHVDDLEAILAAEAVETCHLIGWCTGPKTAIEFYRRCPEAVASMVFLNSSFKCPDSPEELDTAYERNLEPLCRLLDRRPEMAASVRMTLMSRTTDDRLDALENADGERLAARVLSMMNVDLREHVLAPFRSEPALVNYTRQLIDFWSYDARAEAKRVRAPVLMISSEYDQIASPEMSRAAARHLPTARLVQVQGATHYCLYDRPELIAELIEVFFENPDGLDDADGEVKSLPPQRAISADAVWPDESSSKL
jgi:pimeloyl-ACP methyl ester carboxylesterase